jgi:hypothetical protein
LSTEPTGEPDSFGRSIEDPVLDRPNSSFGLQSMVVEDEIMDYDSKEGSAPVKTTGGAMLQHWIFLNFAAVVFHGVLRTREIWRRRTLTAPIIMNPSNRKG